MTRKIAPSIASGSPLIMKTSSNCINLCKYFNDNLPKDLKDTIQFLFIKNKDLIEMASYIDKRRFFELESSHYEFVMDKKEIVSPNDPHPSTEGHVKWAQKIKEFIDANNLRTSE